MTAPLEYFTIKISDLNRTIQIIYSAIEATKCSNRLNLFTSAWTAENRFRGLSVSQFIFRVLFSVLTGKNWGQWFTVLITPR